MFIDYYFLVTVIWLQVLLTPITVWSNRWYLDAVYVNHFSILSCCCFIQGLQACIGKRFDCLTMISVRKMSIYLLVITEHWFTCVNELNKDMFYPTIWVLVVVVLLGVCTWTHSILPQSLPPGDGLHSVWCSTFITSPYSSNTVLECNYNISKLNSCRQNWQVLARI